MKIFLSISSYKDPLLVNTLRSAYENAYHKENIVFAVVDQSESRLDLEELSFIEQINAFKNADIIVGGHGSAFANLAFCKANTRLVEIRQKDHPVSLNKISEINNFDHKVWLIDTNKNGKMFVSIEKLNNYIL